MTLVLTKTNGEWPSVRFAIGCEVVGVRVRPKDSGLILHLSPAFRELVIPPPWTFTSCLMAITSGAEALSGESLIGFHGATLTAVEQDTLHLDLVFGSIRVSIGDSSDPVGVS